MTAALQWLASQPWYPWLEPGVFGTMGAALVWALWDAQ